MSSSKPVLTVYRGASPSLAFLGSPFAIKLEARLRFNSIPYRLAAGSPRTGPRGKIPYIESEDGTQMGDSTLIIRSLVDSGVATDLNANLSPVQHAQDLAVRALVEDKLYFYGVRERWWDHYYVMRDSALGAIPWPMRVLIGLIAYRQVSTMLYGQGTGRYSHEEVAVFKHEAWEAVNQLLTEARRGASRHHPFWVLGGKEPTEADATLFGFVAAAMTCEAAPATRAMVKALPVVVEYADRICDKYFPEYQKWE